MILQRTIVFLLLNVFTGITCSDVIRELPGLSSQPNFTQYSGYLKGYFAGHHLHYWFVESQQNATEDPLVLWMNGGPGCSSLAGLLTEHGPFIVQKDGQTLKDNEFSWNKVANVLYLEAPVGVGFSYADGTPSYVTDDNRTTIDNFYAVQDFLLKYPQLKKNDFYVTGESYGGMYVPLLTQMIAQEAPQINLKGFAIGNGYLDENMNDVSLYFYYFYHGFIGQNDMKAITTFCCNSSYNMRDCEVSNVRCEKALKEVNIGRVNMYNVFDKCYPTESIAGRLSMIEAEANHFRHLRRTHPVIPCMDMTPVTKYLNQRSVRTALHIPASQDAVQWDVCSLAVNLNYGKLYKSMHDQVLSILAHSVRGMIYNGDFDTACNFLGDEWFVDSLGLPLKSDKLEFYVNDNQVAGYVKNYKLLHFVTIKAAGHMVPTDKPEIALKIFTSFLNNTPL